MELGLKKHWFKVHLTVNLVKVGGHVGVNIVNLKQYYEICSYVRPQYTFYSRNFLLLTQIERASRIDNMM